ncbi:hypothetical protein PVAP13_3KG529080 [Panicum virgatum]|uniref:Disease resistance R13L4/SHOC-2-like LRR domain-containing protein n=1 Tax=Panicum virgatum TaxID=38727 RepID=A0A8T0VB11_PANVG|nr:hypothetical protein PVAP13_3KG529080 [Panicum virgatum]
MVLNLVIRCKSIEENIVTAIHHSQATTTLADKFRLLQVLILHFWGDKDSISFDITTISELFRLRYLKVTSNVTLELRTLMRGLKSLETLKIDARVSSVPSDIVHLPGLLHLSIPAETNLPSGIGNMTSLRTLGCFDISSNSIENVQSLSMLTNLEDLQLTCSTVQTENLNSKMQFVLNSILGRLSNLKSLTLASRAPSYAKSIGATGMTISGGFSCLSSAPALLRSLEVSPQICIFLYTPRWIGQLCELCVLKFGVRRIDRDGVDVLRGLPAFSVLTLYVQTKPAARIVIGKTGFPVIKYFRFKCCDALLEFKEGAMPNLRTLKLAFNVNSNADQQSTIPVGIEYLSELKEASAKIGGVGPEESHRRAAELEFRDAIRVHARFQRVNVQCVEQIIECKDDQNSVTTMEYLDDKSSVTTVEYNQSSVITVEPDRSSVTTMEYLDDKSSVTTVEYPPAPAGTSLLRRTRGLRCGQAHVSVGASPSGVPLAAYRNRRDSILREMTAASPHYHHGYQWSKCGQKRIAKTQFSRWALRTPRRSSSPSLTRTPARTSRPGSTTSTRTRRRSSRCRSRRSRRRGSSGSGPRPAPGRTAAAAMTATTSTRPPRPGAGAAAAGSGSRSATTSGGTG